MILKTVYIKGFRNFKEVTVNFDKHSLILGANDVGKTNLVYAMRILLDRGFSDYDFELKESDYYAYEDTAPVYHKIINLKYINLYDTLILYAITVEMNLYGK